jgi:hypothetical protein
LYRYRSNGKWEKHPPSREKRKEKREKRDKIDIFNESENPRESSPRSVSLGHII